MQKWTWVGNGAARSHKKQIEEALHRFERFQLASAMEDAQETIPPLRIPPP
jgi:hypothetical protein